MYMYICRCKCECVYVSVNLYVYLGTVWAETAVSAAAEVLVVATENDKVASEPDRSPEENQCSTIYSNDCQCVGPYLAVLLLIR